MSQSVDHCRALIRQHHAAITAAIEAALAFDLMTFAMRMGDATIVMAAMKAEFPDGPPGELAEQFMADMDRFDKDFKAAMEAAVRKRSMH